jgi:hypothetical protein
MMDALVKTGPLTVAVNAGHMEVRERERKSL